jgi:hypothetical protein
MVAGWPDSKFRIVSQIMSWKFLLAAVRALLPKRERKGWKVITDEGWADAVRCRKRDRQPGDMAPLFGRDGLVDWDGIRAAPLSTREYRLLVWLAYRPSEGWLLTTLFRDQKAWEALQRLGIRGLVARRGYVWQLSPKGWEVLLSRGQLPTLDDLYRGGDLPRLDHLDEVVQSVGRQARQE